MKIMSYTCKQEEIREKRDWLLSLGLKVFRQTMVMDVESSPPSSNCRITFVIPNKEVETYIKLAVPAGTFAKCSA